MRISDWSSYVCSSYLILIRSALFKGESAKTFVETGHLTTSIQQTLIAAGPGRMRGGINIQCHRVAFLAPGGASLERRAIGHLDRDEVIIGMRVLFHMSAPVTAGFRPAWMRSEERRVGKECVSRCNSGCGPKH